MVNLEPIAKPYLPQKPTFWWGLLALALLTAIWGYCNIVIRQLEVSMSPAAFLTLRYGFVGMLGLPFVFRVPRLRWSQASWGLLVGVALATATLCQATAMRSIPVDNVAFLTALYVVLTPILMALWKRRAPARLIIVAALTSLLGAGLLIGHVSFTAAIGSLWALGAAVLATLQIIGTAEVARTVTTMQLTILEALGAALTLLLYLTITGGWAHHPFQELSLHMPVAILWRLAYLAIPGMLAAGWLQVWGQRQITATEAALAFNLEPVWTAIFSWVVLSQFLRWGQIVGAALILASLVTLSIQSGEVVELEIPGPEAPDREH